MSIYSEIRPEVLQLSELSLKSSAIDPELYQKYDVKRGLRDLNGKGVLTGLTNISEIVSSKMVDGKSVPCEGSSITGVIMWKTRSAASPRTTISGSNEPPTCCYSGTCLRRAASGNSVNSFPSTVLFPTSFVRDIIMKAPSSDMMNTLARSVLTLYSYDEAAEDISVPNVLRQCIQLIALFPLLSVYGYQAYRHYHDGQSLFIHQPDPKLPPRKISSASSGQTASIPH